MQHELEISIFDLDVSSRSQYYLARSCWISLESLGKDKHIGIFEFVLEIIIFGDHEQDKAECAAIYHVFLSLLVSKR